MKPFAEVYATLPEGWLSEKEAECLYRWAGQVSGAILEVGSYKGRSSVLLAATGRPLICVDPFANFDSDDVSGSQIYATFLRNLDERGYHVSHGRDVGLVLAHGPGERPIVRLRVMPIEDYTVPEVGFAYLDGDHTFKGTTKQIEKAIEGRAKIIAVHDVNDSGEGAHVKAACLKLLGPWNERVEKLAVWDRR